MADFIEVKTKNGAVMINLEDISYLEKAITIGFGNSEDQTLLVLKSGKSLIVLEPYSDVSNFVCWVADGRPDLGCSDEACEDCGETCPDCGEELVETPGENKNKDN